MKNKYKIAPSILSCDFANLGQEIAAVTKAGADWLHVDVMDGMFVPNISIGVPVVASLRAITKLPLDVHLMVHEPIRYVEAFAKAGADIITVHVEACTHLNSTLQAIRDLGKKVGVALNPATPIHTLEHVYELLDLILVMTVNPGFGGQSFIPASIDKIKQLKQNIIHHNQIMIEVDGGIDIDNIAEVAEVGAQVFVAGSAIFLAKDGYAQAIQQMKAKLTHSFA